MDGWFPMAADDAFESNEDGTRRSRWCGILGVSVTRLWKRTVRTRSSRVLATVCAVALTIALLVVVTGVALGLADGGAVDDADADVQIVPEESGTLSAVDGVEGPRLGETNDRAETIRESDGVDHASPVLIEPVELESPSDDESVTILLVGVDTDDESRTVGGLSTAQLAGGDDGGDNESDATSQDGTIVLSEPAADRLDAAPDDDIAVGSSHVPEGVPAPSMTATDIESTDDETPVALVDLEQLQTLSGADDDQLADQVLVWGDDDAAASAADDEYPDAAVETHDGTDPSALFNDGLAFATSVLTFVIGIAICASFVATTAGMTVTEERRTLAVLEAVGYPTRSRLSIVAVSTMLTTIVGALVGIVLGIGGIALVNAIATATIAPGAVAIVHPILVPYALGVALVSGLVAIPYPLAVAARTSSRTEVGR